MKHDLNLTLKMYKVVFSDKQIAEIKRKMHIDNIFTYSDSEIALKVCRNKLRIKLNRRPLSCVVYLIDESSSRPDGKKYVQYVQAILEWRLITPDQTTSPHPHPRV